MNTDPRRVCELLVGLGDVEVLGVDDDTGKPLRVHVRWRALRLPCSGCGGLLRSYESARAIAQAVLHKTGWLPPGCCAIDARLIIDAGLVVLPNGEWLALALSSSKGRRYDRSVKWLGLAACRIYAVVGNDSEHNCRRQGDPPSDLLN